MPAKILIDYNSFYNLYITQNLSIKDTAKALHISTASVCRFIKAHNIKKQTDNLTQLRKSTCLIKYGVDNPSKLKEIKLKKEKTCLKHYGKKYPFQSEECKQKSKNTCIAKYGVDNASKNQEIINKVKQTCLIRYGVDVPVKSKAIQKKMQTTCINKYGVRHAMQVQSIKDKVFQSKKNNHTINTSRSEELIYISLKNTFKIVERQYKSDKYPFHCDFYIPEIDTYIEYQGNWTHGKRSDTDIIGPYNPTNKKHQKILKTWIEKSKTNPAYKSAIKVWTITDPLKRETAKKNNLNWIEFWTVDQFNDWLNNLLGIKSS